MVVEDRGMGDEGSSTPVLLSDRTGTGEVSSGKVAKSGDIQNLHGSMNPQALGTSTQTAHPQSNDESDHAMGAFGMQNLTSSLPAYESRGLSPLPYQDTQRYPLGMGGMAQYGSQPFHGSANYGAANYPIHSHGSDASSLHMFNQMQAAQRNLGGPTAFAPSQYQNNPNQPTFMYYGGQPGAMAAAPQYNQNYNPSGMNAQNRMYFDGYAGSPTPNPQLLRPRVPIPSRGSSGSSSGSMPSAPRGPPRKPKQSGHALWVGNLPSGTNVADLKDHFSREATNEIESVFLISKSNCAFVNYRSDTACAAAMQRFHDSRFQGVRLVCRLRRGPNNPVNPVVPGAPSGPSASIAEPTASQSAPDAITQNRQVSSRAFEEATNEARRRGLQAEKVSEKFFIMKSLTVEDMELSVHNKIWATQAHNEEALNQAYESADHVYLIFSANKSGEYFGIARMASPIHQDVTLESDWIPRSGKVSDDTDVPRSIPTPATDSAPKGRIIDDSARGTIFWEADHGDSESPSSANDDASAPIDDGVKIAPAKDTASGAASNESQSFGRPFKIEWVSTDRLPFYRTRGLRNPWNANREVKIARDGTELETSVGRRLLLMFSESRMSDPRAPMDSYAMTR